MLEIYTFKPQGYFGSNTYLVKSGGEYAVIDPAVDFSEVVSHHPEIKGKINYVIITHAHFDHILKIDSWLSDNTRVLVGKDDAKALGDSYLNCYLGFFGTDEGYFGPYDVLCDLDEIRLGEDIITAISAPGHTPGGMMYKSGSDIFVGDTVFEKGGYGRCDLPGGDIEVLEKTLVKLFSMKDDAVLYPGHGDTTTLSDCIKYFM